jgi:hypothetical protein
MLVDDILEDEIIKFASLINCQVRGEKFQGQKAVKFGILYFLHNTHAVFT